MKVGTNCAEYVGFQVELEGNTAQYKSRISHSFKQVSVLTTLQLGISLGICQNFTLPTLNPAFLFKLAIFLKHLKLFEKTGS